MIALLYVLAGILVLAGLSLFITIGVLIIMNAWNEPPKAKHRNYYADIGDRSLEYILPPGYPRPKNDHYLRFGSSEVEDETKDGTIRLTVGRDSVTLTPDEAEEIGESLKSLANDARRPQEQLEFPFGVV